MKSPSLDFRPYRYKNVYFKFFCPLCRTERAFTIGPRLTLINYCQILFLTFFFSAILWPWMGAKGLFLGLIFWAGVEWGRRVLFKKEIPCPHCGFDASTYKKDVKRAREQVLEFWQEKSPKEEPQPLNEQVSL